MTGKQQDTGASTGVDRATRQSPSRSVSALRAGIASAGGLTADELTEAFEYLDQLRASGRTNMWNASAYIVRELCWPPHEASEATVLWIRTYSRDVPVAQRVAQGIEAGTGETADAGSTAKPRKPDPEGAPND